MSTASLLTLLLLAASCYAQLPQQGRTALGDDICSLQAATINCACRPGQEVLSLTASYMERSGAAEALGVSGCSSVTFAFPPLQKLQALLVENTASATFEEKASPMLRHLELVNVSQVVLHGPIFKNAGLEKVFFDGVRVSSLPSGAFANLTKIQNVTFRDVHFNAVEQGAVEFRMVNDSELTILGSKLLGVEKSGIVVRGVANFTMQKSMLTTVGDNGLQLDVTGPVSISDSQLQTTGPIKLSLASSSSLSFVDNVWRNSSIWEVAQQLLLSSSKLAVTGNTFRCTCNPELQPLIVQSAVAPLLENNRCDESLCGWPVAMSVLTSCGNQTELQAACKTALPAGATTTPGKSTPSGVTASPRAAKPQSPGTKMNNTATTVAISVTAALLLTVPTAAALAL